MANKYEKGEFEEYFHVNPEFSRTGPDMLRTEKQAAGIAGNGSFIPSSDLHASCADSGITRDVPASHGGTSSTAGRSRVAPAWS